MSRQTPRSNSPVVGISCNLKVDGAFRHHTTGNRNVTAIAEVTGALPLLIPAFSDGIDVDTLLDMMDGIMLTGGVSNIDPHHYGQDPAPGEDVRDPDRDHLAFAIIRAAIRREVPLLGTCRGIQEINVALGGTLHQRLHDVPGRHDHRRNRDLPIEEAVQPREHIRLTSGGMLAGLLGADEAIVNSLHGQGIDQLAPSLVVEAIAADGTIEAVRVHGAETFALGVQWHVEIGASEEAINRAILTAFGDAVRYRASRRHVLPYMDEAAE